MCIIGKAALGKTFQRGRRAPFWWSAVRRGITGVDIGRKLCALLLSAVGEQDPPEFLLFDFAPKRASINSVSAIAAHKMGITRYTRFSTQLLQGPPAACTLEEATEFSDTYCERRVLPTLADLRQFSTGERGKVGGWAGDEARDDKRAATIPDSYVIRSAILFGLEK